MEFKLESTYKPSGDQPKAIAALIKGLQKGDRHQTLLGVTGSGKTFTMANVIAAIQKPTLVIAPNKTLAAQLYQEYKAFFPKNRVAYFVSYYDYYQPEAYLPVTDTYIEKEAMINEEIDRYRHVATSSLLTRRDVIVVASVSCIYNLGVPENYFDSIVKLEVSKPMTRGDLVKWLIKIGFERNNAGMKRGSFRVRGDVFEVYPASEEIAYKIDLTDQKVKELAVVDKLTRKIKEDLTELIIFPPKHFVTTLPERERAIKDIRAELKERLVYLNKKGLLLEAERLERRTKYDTEMLSTLGFCHGIENYSRHLSGKPVGSPPDTLLDYFPHKSDGKPRPKGEARPRGAADFLTIIDESHIAVPQIRGMYAGDQARKKVLVEFGWRLPSALDNRPLDFKEFNERVGQIVFTSATPADYEREKSNQVIEQIVRPTGLVDPPIEVRPVFAKNAKGTGKNANKEGWSQVDDVMEEAMVRAKKGQRTMIITLTKKMAEELASFLKEKGFKAQFMHSDTKTFERTKILESFRRGPSALPVVNKSDMTHSTYFKKENKEAKKEETIPIAGFDILVGVNLLREGLDLPEVTLVAILDADREGFLRSETSLVQTMGRAARNVEGKVILYADTITGSMQRAMNECARRRKIQLEYNRKHKITPQTIKKEIREM